MRYGKRRISGILAIGLCFALFLTRDLTARAADSRVEQAVQTAIAIANDPAHGYSQKNRQGNPDYDCSSLVCSVFHDAGFGVEKWGSTASIPQDFQNNGFTYLTDLRFTNAGDLQRGDILWRPGHVEIYIGDGKIVGAHSAQSSAAHPNRSPESGDQGDEISVCSYYNAPWEGVLRYDDATLSDGERAQILQFLQRILDLFLRLLRRISG